MKKDYRIKKPELLVVVLLLLVTVFAGCAEQTSLDEKSIVIEVNGIDGYENLYEVTTEVEYLGELLDEMQIAQLVESDFGRYIVSVDGYVADEMREYWSISHNGDYATAGADELILGDGDIIILAIDEF